MDFIITKDKETGLVKNQTLIIKESKKLAIIRVAIQETIEVAKKENWKQNRQLNVYLKLLKEMQEELKYNNKKEVFE